MLEMGKRREGEWLPPVMKTEASRGVGIDELVAECGRHRQHLFSSGVLERFIAEKNTAVFTDMLKERLFGQLYDALVADGSLRRIIAGMANREIDPYSAVEDILAASLAYHPALPR